MPAHVGVLLEQHDPRPGHDLAQALVGVDHPGEAFEQGRLARAVAPDQRQPVARPDVDVEPAEQPAFALDQAKIFEAQDRGCHGARPSLASRPRHACLNRAIVAIIHKSFNALAIQASSK